MDQTATIEHPQARQPSLARSGALFIVIGALLYLAVYALSERLLYRTGDSNALFKIATAQTSDFDWVILGASHAMPLDFADFNAFMQDETGLKILNLAGPGTGPLYNGFILEEFFRAHKSRNVLYVLDSFAFYDKTWNEDRFSDAKLLSRTPFAPSVAGRLLRYTMKEGVDPRALLDYVSGFSKINNRDRFERDVWEGEAQFERAARASSAADAKRIAYLYPRKTQDQEALTRYLGVFERLLDLAARQGAAVTVIKPPLPPQFYRRLPNEAAFDAAVSSILTQKGVRFLDFSHAIPEPRLYFDTDHLNREGLNEFFSQHLKPILVPRPSVSADGPWGEGGSAPPAPL
jgi:hypothetical protein